MKTFIAGFVATTLLATTAAFAGGAQFYPGTYTTYKKHPPYSGSVAVLNHAPSDNNWTELGMVRVSTKNTSNFDVALNDLKSRAAYHGGTAIILQDDARIFSEGGLTDKGTPPENVTAIAILR